ncbi:MAG: tetraacyldisaccharide 4'-kinase [Rhodospirillales bacterium]|nr:tetraacyldisaccharide 4'-kinase [Rhodospirillales bacterium]
MKPPDFWWKEGESGWGSLLEPLAQVYRLVAERRFASIKPQNADVPVICIGNLVVGGAGKTPVGMSIAARLCKNGLATHFLSRGFGGRSPGPLRVNPKQHAYEDVGDEPLLLAEVSPTWISRDRVAGCRAAVADGAEIIVMDDGFQNPSIIKNLSFLVIDAAQGFGNGRMLPAGPLRETVAGGLLRADAVVLMGDGGTDINKRIGQLADRDFPVLRARVKPLVLKSEFAGKPVFAFAGIGNPKKFFTTLEGIGCRIEEAQAFPDHHPYSNAEIEGILARAERGGMVPMTTAKDAVRLAPEYRSRVNVLQIDVEWENESALDQLLLPFRRKNTGR